MEKLALLAILQSKPGKEAEVEAFLKSALPLAVQEQGTVRWYALKLGSGRFGIFDTFADAAGKEAHLSGRLRRRCSRKPRSCWPRLHRLTSRRFLRLSSGAAARADQQQVHSLVPTVHPGCARMVHPRSVVHEHPTQVNRGLKWATFRWSEHSYPILALRGWAPCRVVASPAPHSGKRGSSA